MVSLFFYASTIIKILSCHQQCVSLVLSLISSSLDAWRTRQYDYYQRVLNGILWGKMSLMTRVFILQSQLTAIVVIHIAWESHCDVSGVGSLWDGFRVEFYRRCKGLLIVIYGLFFSVWGICNCVGSNTLEV